MKLPINFGNMHINDRFMFRLGHNEARNAAAELALKADAEIERFKLGHDRYEKLRRLNVPQFADLYKKNISSGIAFDTLVDELNI